MTRQVATVDANGLVIPTRNAPERWPRGIRVCLVSGSLSFPSPDVSVVCRVLVRNGTAGSKSSRSATQSELQKSASESLKIVAIPRVLPPNRTGNSIQNRQPCTRSSVTSPIAAAYPVRVPGVCLGLVYDPLNVDSFCEGQQWEFFSWGKGESIYRR